MAVPTTFSWALFFSWYSASTSMHCLRTALSSSIKGRKLGQHGPGDQESERNENSNNNDDDDETTL